MKQSDNIWLHYLELPRTNTEPIKIGKILECRIRRYRYVREARLKTFEGRFDGPDYTN